MASESEGTFVDDILLNVFQSVSPTFVRAVSEGAGAADGPRPLLQRVGAATQWVTLPVQVKGVLSRDAVGAAHAAAACWEVVLADVGRAHCTMKERIRSVIYVSLVHFRLYILSFLVYDLHKTMKNDRRHVLHR